MEPGRPDTDDRTIRVFVSSTFRDMQAERDLLVNEVFPQLRELCARRAVAFSEIDLRWGLTDEEVAEGKVLPTCLAEIDRCRPYFIGLLGERYGWVPHEIPAELREREPWLIPEAGATSVTELEILHGVLRNPKMAGHASFYLRDPAYVDSPAVPESERAFFREGPSPAEIEALGEEEAASRAKTRQRKLNELKQRLTESGFPTTSYSHPAELAERVRTDFTALIDRLYPEDEALDPLAAESRLHDFFAESRSKVYVKRATYFDALDDFAERGEGGALSVLGESGRGKSALLATWALGYRSEHPDALTLMHFIGSSQKSAELVPMLSRLNFELGRYLELEDETERSPVEQPGESPDQVRTFKERLYAAGRRGKVVLVLDALNQLADEDGARGLGWLPAEIPDGVRLVVSTLPGESKDELERRGWTEDALRVRQLEHEESVALIERYLGEKSLADSRKQALASLPQAGNPLYLRVFLDELRIWGSHEDLDARIAELAEAPSIPALLEQVLARYERRFDSAERPGLVADAMRLIWASRQGLEEGELLDLLGDGSKLPPAHWSPLRIAASEMLIDRGGLLDFAHDFFRAAVEDRYVGDAETRRATRRRLADYMKGRGSTPRALEELPKQLVELEAWEELAGLLADPESFRALWYRDQSEVRRLWARIQSSSEIRAGDAYASVADGAEANGNGDFLVDASILLSDLGSFDPARSLLERAARVARASGDDPILAMSLGNLALIHKARGDRDRALELLDEQERIGRKLGNKYLIAQSLTNQGLIRHHRGRIEALPEEQDRAMALAEEAETLFRDVGDLAGVSVSLLNQGVYRLGRGELDRAWDLFLEHEQICRELGDSAGLAESARVRALTFKARGEPHKALELFREGELLCRDLGNLSGIQNLLGEQADIHDDLDEPERAIELQLARESLCRQLGDSDGLLSCMCDLGILLCETKPDRALSFLQEGCLIAREVGDRDRPLAVMLALESRILRVQGHVALGESKHEEAEALAQASGDADLPELVSTIAGAEPVEPAASSPSEASRSGSPDEIVLLEIESNGGPHAFAGDPTPVSLEASRLDAYLEQSQALEQSARERGDLAGLQQSLGVQALIHARRGDFKQAEALCRAQSKTCKKIGRSELAGAHGTRALIERWREKGPVSRVYLRKQEGIYRKLDDPTGLAVALANQAFVFLADSDGRRAASTGEEAITVAGTAGLEGLVEALEARLGDSTGSA
jgi:tetratricopeptide (TPR) repeat protein